MKVKDAIVHVVVMMLINQEAFVMFNLLFTPFKVEIWMSETGLSCFH